jgi:hypothetical protein
VNKLRWGKFFWSDWADDPALALCSLAAQGLWMRMLCIAAQGTPYGHVNIKGKAPTVVELAKLVRAKPSLVTRWIAELERRGVAATDASGCHVSARMVSDGIRSRARASAANSRWHKENRADLHMQNQNFASTEADAEADAKESPPVGSPASGGPRGRARMNGVGRRKPSRNGFVDIALDMIEERNAEADDARPSGARVVDLARHLGSRKPPA